MKMKNTILPNLQRVYYISLIFISVQIFLCTLGLPPPELLSPPEPQATMENIKNTVRKTSFFVSMIGGAEPIPAISCIKEDNFNGVNIKE